jgi:hypothetical protein
VEIALPHLHPLPLSQAHKPDPHLHHGRPRLRGAQNRTFQFMVLAMKR